MKALVKDSKVKIRRSASDFVPRFGLVLQYNAISSKHICRVKNSVWFFSPGTRKKYLVSICKGQKAAFYSTMMLKCTKSVINPSARVQSGILYGHFVAFTRYKVHDIIR